MTGSTKTGVGYPNADVGSYQEGVYSWLRMGYPRLALAVAQGIPLVPYYFNVRATFDDPTVNLIPQVGSDTKIISDTIIDSVVGRVTRDRTPTNRFDPQSDFYYGFTSGIEVKVNVVGMPRPSIANKFTPLSNFCDMFNGDSHANGGWILTFSQQLEVDFSAARIQLSDFPTTVIMTFRAWTPDTNKFDGAQISANDALQRLVACGYVVPDCYTTATKS